MSEVTSYQQRISALKESAQIEFRDVTKMYGQVAAVRNLS